MAKDDELELDVKAEKPAGKSKLILLVAAIMLVTTGSLVGALYFMGMLGAHGSSNVTSGKKIHSKAVSIKPSYYLSLQPPFVVNFADPSHASYLQVEMQVMAHDKKILNIVRENMPVVRNNILLILSAQKFEQVSTRAGKLKLQQDILQAIQKIVSSATQAKSAAGNGEGDKNKSADATNSDNVAQVYFTSFIMQ